MNNNQNITPEQKDFDELTIETQSFLITFITNLSTVAMRAIAKNKLDKTAAYHDYRQLLIYYNALLEMLYSEELADDVLEAFDTQAPENIVENDENIMKLRVSLSTAGEADVVICGGSSRWSVSSPWSPAKSQ